MKPLYTLFFLLLASAAQCAAGPAVTDAHIHIDQFGYLPGAEKTAVIANPITGYNSAAPFLPGSVYQVKRWSDDVTVFTGSPQPWNNGATHGQSGDQVWWFDFSAVSAPGDYYIYDSVQAVGSYRFAIGESVYADVLKAAARALYYQRCGTPKATPYAGAGWTDAACHTGPLQDGDCRLYSNPVAATSRDLHGGWHDAGDYNKYVNFTYGALIDLLLAYQENPAVWTDDYNIPESGNAVPDLLDECKVELDWLRRMQQSDGGVLSVVGVQNFAGGSPPGSDGAQRFYGPATTSATFSTAAVFALASVQYKSLGIPAMTSYGDSLEAAAIAAWSWATANPSQTFYNSGLIASGENETGSDELGFRQLCAASFLFVLTADTACKSYFDAHYNSAHLMQWGYAYPFEHTTQDALLYYSRATGADAAIANSIKTTFAGSVTSSADNYGAYLSNTDAYRAYLPDQNYVWGTNTVKSAAASMLLSLNTYNLNTANAAGYENAAAGYVHYFHGVNPTGFTFLTNMSGYGAEQSVNEIYHSWFHDGSALWDRAGVSTYGPAPGFIPGGPNPSYALDACCAGSCAGNALCNTANVTPPLGQPVQKSYADWNADWPADSWTVTEISIYTQAAYIRMLSRFVTPVAAGVAGTKPATDGLRVFPNPASAQLTIVPAGTAPAVVSLTDASGRIVLRQSICGSATISLKGIAPGIYALFYEWKDGKIVRRILVQ